MSVAFSTRLFKMPTIFLCVATWAVLTASVSCDAPLKAPKKPSYLQEYYISSAPNRVAVCGFGKCRGSLWNAQWVLTTVECIKNDPVEVYHLHDQEFDCSNITYIGEDEKRIVDKICRHPKFRKHTDTNIVLLHLEKPYENTTHMNWTASENNTLDFFMFEPWITSVLDDHYYEPEKEMEEADHNNQLYLARQSLSNSLKRKTPAFNVFATIIMLPLVTFVVVYFVISFFSRSPKSDHVVKGYYLFGKRNSYDDTII